MLVYPHKSPEPLLFSTTSHGLVAKKKGLGFLQGVVLPPPENPPPGGGGPGSELNKSSIGKYIPDGHPYTDRVPAAAFPTSTLHTQYGYDSSGNSLGAFVDVNLVDSGNRATNTALLNSAIETNRMLNQNTRINLPSTFPMFSPELKEITNAGRWIYIQRATEPTAEGTRANPINMATAPECMAGNAGEPCIYTWRKASRYYIMGLKFVRNPSVGTLYDLLLISPQESSVEYDTDIANVNEDIIIDRCLIEGDDNGDGATFGGVRRGARLAGHRIHFVNNYVHKISQLGNESQGLLITNGAGPYKIVNNFFECASIGAMIGGDVPHFGVVVGRPSDVEWRRNYHTKRLSWCPTHPAWDGIELRNGKGLFETKNVLRLLFEGNVLDGCWVDGQAGMILVLKSALGISVSAAGMGTEDVTLRYNILRNSVRPWNFQGLDDITAEYMKRICAYDNLLYNMGTFAGQTGGTKLITHQIDDLYLRHNTLVHNETTSGTLNYDYPSSPRSQRHVFTDCIFSTGSPELGLFMSGGLIGGEALNAWAENPAWERQIMVGAYDEFIQSKGPIGTTFISSFAAMNFANAAGNDYHLTPSSPGWQGGVNGKNLGADIDKVNLATSGVV